MSNKMKGVLVSQVAIALALALALSLMPAFATADEASYVYYEKGGSYGGGYYAKFPVIQGHTTLTFTPANQTRLFGPQITGSVSCSISGVAHNIILWQCFSHDYPHIAVVLPRIQCTDHAKAETCTLTFGAVEHS